MVVIGLSFQPSHPGSIRAEGAKMWNGRLRSVGARSAKQMHERILALLQNLAL